MNLQWHLNSTASCYHAAACVYWGRPVNERVSAALAEPVARFKEAFHEERVPADRFWNFVVPFAPDFLSAQTLADVALKKTIGAVESSPPRVRRFTHLLQTVRLVLSEILPKVEETLTAPFQNLQQQWNRQGGGLLGAAVPWTDPDLIVEDASVVGLQPIVGGAGSANLPGNRATIEVLETDPVADLPEVLRLAWLISQLNLDLPRFAENVSPVRRERVIALAMIPVMITAAENAQLLRFEEGSFERAVQLWLPEEKNAATMLEWWEVYRTMRPTWPSALRALDEMLAG